MNVAKAKVQVVIHGYLGQHEQNMLCEALIYLGAVQCSVELCGGKAI